MYISWNWTHPKTWWPTNNKLDRDKFWADSQALPLYQCDIELFCVSRHVWTSDGGYADKTYLCCFSIKYMNTSADVMDF